ncbi:hypothetical protein LEMLEM_LOCUS24631, partial [Lemmus lemmus]
MKPGQSWRQRTPRWKSRRMEGVSTSELSHRRRHPASGLTQTTCLRTAGGGVALASQHCTCHHSEG